MTMLLINPNNVQDDVEDDTTYFALHKIIVKLYFICFFFCKLDVATTLKLT